MRMRLRTVLPGTDYCDADAVVLRRGDLAMHEYRTHDCSSLSETVEN